MLNVKRKNDAGLNMIKKVNISTQLRRAVVIDRKKLQLPEEYHSKVMRGKAEIGSLARLREQFINTLSIEIKIFVSY